jgi:hypothetical protein
MEPQMYRYARHAARFSRLPLNSPLCAAAATNTAKDAARQFRGLLALAVVVLANASHETRYTSSLFLGLQSM